MRRGAQGYGRPASARWHAAAVALALLAVTFGAPSQAQDASKPKLAYVLANGAYVKLGELKNPTADGELVAKSLKDAGFTVTYLRNLNEQGFRTALRQIARESAKADIALIYYAGHGVQIGGVNYLLPVDLAMPDSEDDIRLASISADDLLSVVKSQYKIVVLDACRENPELGRALSRGRGASYRRGLAPVAPPADESGGIFIAYSTQSDAVALDGDGANSPFAESFARNVGAHRSVDDMFALVTHDVLTKTGGAQRPFKYASLDNVFCLAGDCQTAAAAPVAAPAATPAATAVPAAPSTATATRAVALPMSPPDLSATFKRLSASRSAETRERIEEQLWDYLRASLPERTVFGFHKEDTGDKVWAYAFYPKTATTDGHRATVTTESGLYVDGVAKFSGIAIEDEIIDCDTHERSLAKTLTNGHLRLYTKAQQASGKTKINEHSSLESLAGLLCRLPLRLLPLWAVDSVEWTSLGSRFSIATSVVYSDPREPGIRRVLGRWKPDKPEPLKAAVEYAWFSINCRTKEGQGNSYFRVAADGTLMSFDGIEGPWKEFAAESADANAYVLLCDQ